MIQLSAGGIVVDAWEEARIPIDMLTAADGFDVALTHPTRELYDLCGPDQAVRLGVAGRVVLSGLVDNRQWTDGDGGSRLQVGGRDKVGRMVDESMPLMSFTGMTLLDVAKRCAAPHLTTVTLTNAKNRSVVTGRDSVKARLRAATEPVTTYASAVGYRSESSTPTGFVQETNRRQNLEAFRYDIREINRLKRKLAATPPGPPLRARKRTEPGESRWETLQAFLDEAGLLAWSTGDAELFIGRPNYAQPATYHFFQPAEGSSRTSEGNVNSFEIFDDVGDRYSRIVVLGSGKGNAKDKGKATRRTAICDDGTGDKGTGGDFMHQKVLFVVDNDLRDAKRAEERAVKEMAYRDAAGHFLRLTVTGHEQDGLLYWVDTMAAVEHEATGVSGLYMITGVTFSTSRMSGDTTELYLVPKDTELRQQ